MLKDILILGVWALLGAAVAAGDFLTGPHFQFSYFFMVPVGLAAWFSGRTAGLALAVLMPSLQSAYFAEEWIRGFGPTAIAGNLAMQVSAFSAFAELIHRTASARRFRVQILESIPVGMWVLDRRGKLMHANDEGLAIWGGRPVVEDAGAVEPRIWRFGTQERLEGVRRPAFQALLEGRSIKDEIFEIERAGGGRRIIQGSARPVLDKRGGIEGAVVVNQDITEAKRRELEREDLIRSLEEARRSIKVLSGLLPICATCKRIRDDRGAWQPMESYISAHSEAQFSHGLCADCLQRHYPEYAGKLSGS